MDTGLFYRGLTALALAKGVSTQDGEGLSRLVPELESLLDPPNQRQRNLGADDHPALWPAPDFVAGTQSPPVEAHVSTVAGQEVVRAALLPLQRRAAEAERVVAAGRDVGSVVFPQAAIKVYLDASLAERARRRASQAGQASEEATVGAALSQRDESDSGRAVAPLTVPPGAVVVSTDGQSIEEVVSRIEQMVNEARAHPRNA
jgi:cytidylate kinase